jgi:hypothetical protein
MVVIWLPLLDVFFSRSPIKINMHIRCFNHHTLVRPVLEVRLSQLFDLPYEPTLFSVTFAKLKAGHYCFWKLANDLVQISRLRDIHSPTRTCLAAYLPR